MKKLLVGLFAIFICTFAIAHTMEWHVDDSIYQTTTCETGTDLTLPTPAPTKYGYHFVGWQFDEIMGTGFQSGTPTPTNPIEPTFRPFGNTVLRALGTGNNMVADSYNPITKTLTRRVGVEILDGTESYNDYSYGFYLRVKKNDTTNAPNTVYICTHSTHVTNYVQGLIYWPTAYTDIGITLGDKTALKAWIAGQYQAGTPVTFYYELLTPVEEQVP